MEAKNLTPENVQSLSDQFNQMTHSNPDLDYKFHKQEDGIEHDSEIRRLEQKIDAINTKLDLIFGDSVLINGQFRSINPKP